MIFGAPPLSWAIPPELRGQVIVGDFFYPRYRAADPGGRGRCASPALWFLLQRTPFGRVVRAGVQNPDMVGALGISLEPYMAAVAFLGIGLGGLAGVMLAPIFTVHPAMGAGDHHLGLRGRGDRRARLVLGRGDRRGDRGRGQGRRHRARAIRSTPKRRSTC